MDKRILGFLRAGLRRLSLKWPPRNKALEKSRSKYTGKDKRRKWTYTCNGCKKKFKRTEVELDHIIPCGPLTEKAHIVPFIASLFVGISGFQVLCKPCHKKKTHS